LKSNRMKKCYKQGSIDFGQVLLTCDKPPWVLKQCGPAAPKFRNL
jgi:hypothetical protein